MDFITGEEKKELENELREHIASRKELTTRIATARDLGDLKENAEYHAAREDQGLNEAKIRELESRLQTAQVADDAEVPDDMVFLGATVLLKDLEDDEEEKYRLVGNPTGDFTLDYIEVTPTSPMGISLMKARIGETNQSGSAPRHTALRDPFNCRLIDSFKTTRDHRTPQQCAGPGVPDAAAGSRERTGRRTVLVPGHPGTLFSDRLRDQVPVDHLRPDQKKGNQPQTALTWVILLMGLPILGFVLYGLFGEERFGYFRKKTTCRRDQASGHAGRSCQFRRRKQSDSSDDPRADRDPCRAGLGLRTGEWKPHRASGGFKTLRHPTLGGHQCGRGGSAPAVLHLSRRQLGANGRPGDDRGCRTGCEVPSAGGCGRLQDVSEK